jgi:hypothetical protein|tara:strand:+ start:93 stop:638 length:546 start_codon:yes stop_codon:yes gene_type:complete
MEIEQLIKKFREQQPESVMSYEEPGVNKFDAPIPGQSLTDEPGNYPWEHPPKTPSIEEATDYVYESIMKPENMERMFTLLRMGIPIEALVKIITFSGFLEGRWTVDTAKLLEPIVAMMVAGEAALAEIPAKVNMGDAENTEFFKDMSERKRDMIQAKEMKEMPMIEMDTPAPRLGLMAKGE